MQNGRHFDYHGNDITPDEIVEEDLAVAMQEVLDKKAALKAAKLAKRAAPVDEPAPQDPVVEVPVTEEPSVVTDSLI
jgi:hypothetical protein